MSSLPRSDLASFLNSSKYNIFSERKSKEFDTNAPVVSVPAKKSVIN